MKPTDANKQGNDTRTEGQAPQRRPEGKEGAGAHQQGRGSQQTGQTNRRAEDVPEDGSGQKNSQKGGDQADRAAKSGETGERNFGSAKDKPEPKDQDEKGMGTPRNR